MAPAPGFLFLACVAFAARTDAYKPDIAVDVGAQDTGLAFAAGNGTCVPFYNSFTTCRVLESGGFDLGGPTPDIQCHDDQGTHASKRAPR
eukprot:12103806-Alexandrium_andersonii.AAC.1